MTKILDILLIAALCYNLFNTYSNYTPEMELMGTSIPTWVAVLVQVVCIVLIGAKLYKNYAANKQV